MRIVILGAGAMGSFFGARLALAGHEIALIDTFDAHVTTVRKHGLTLVEDGREEIIPMQAAIWPTDVKPGDILLVFTKANKATEALSGVRKLAARCGAIAILANGIGLGRELARIVPEVPMLHGATAAGAILDSPGRVRFTVRGDTFLGPVAGRTPECAKVLGRALNAAGLPTTVTDMVDEYIWTKVMINIAYNAGTALTRLTNGDFVRHAHGRRIIEEAIAEAIAVARAAGISIHYADPLRHVVELGMFTISPNKSSMLQDVIRERETEVDWMNGAIVKEGDQRGVPVPVNRTLWGLVTMLQEGYARPLSTRADSVTGTRQKNGGTNEA